MNTWVEQRYKWNNDKSCMVPAGWSTMYGGEYSHQLGSFVFCWKWMAIVWGIIA